MNNESSDLSHLLGEYATALAYTAALIEGLSDDEIRWRPHEQSSAIGWHLGHQAAVAHYLVRNLLAAEPRIDPALEALMDSATDECQRGALPALHDIVDFRRAAARSVERRITEVDIGHVGAPAQLRVVARGVITAIVNHEYQHSQWVAEVRSRDLGHALPARPSSPLLREIDGYLVLGASGERLSARG